MDEEYIPVFMVVSWLLLVAGAVLLNGRGMRREVKYREALYGKVVWRVSSLVKFPRLNQDFYQGTQAALEGVGFKFLADYEDERLAGTYMDPRTVRRVMVSKDGKVVARFFQYNFSPWRQLRFIFSRGLKNPYVVEFFSEAVDGRVFRLLSIPGPMRPFEPPEIVLRVEPPGEETADALYGRFLAENIDFSPRVFSSYEDVLASEERQQELRIRFRKEKGLVFPEELRGEGMIAKSVDSFVRAFERERRRMRGGGDD